MKVLFVLEYFYPHVGGVETSFLNLARELAKHNDVMVITSWIPGTDLQEVYEKINILRVKTPSYARRFWFTIISLKTLLKLAGNFDYIHTTAYNAALPAWLVSKILKKRIVITVPEVFGKNWFNLGERNMFLNTFFYLYEQILFRLPFDLYIAISRSTKKDLLRNFKIDQKKVRIIYCILDLDFWNPRKYNGNKIRKKLELNDKFVYLYYGRPGISKGLEYLLMAVHDISISIPNSLLMLILSNDPRNRYEMMKDIIEKEKISDSVLLLESLNYRDLPYYIAAADCVVVPSLTEGFGYSAIESAIMDKIVISTKVGAIPELNPNGFFIKAKSSRTIANSLSLVVNNKKNSNNIRKRLIRILDRENILDNYLRSVRAILSNRC